LAWYIQYNCTSSATSIYITLSRDSNYGDNEDRIVVTIKRREEEEDEIERQQGVLAGMYNKDDTGENRFGRRNSSTATFFPRRTNCRLFKENSIIKDAKKKGSQLVIMVAYIYTFKV
jgi:hypothetical protein